MTDHPTSFQQNIAPNPVRRALDALFPWSNAANLRGSQSLSRHLRGRCCFAWGEGEGRHAQGLVQRAQESTALVCGRIGRRTCGPREINPGSPQRLSDLPIWARQWRWPSGLVARYYKSVKNDYCHREVSSNAKF
jgi:hypothetical protein